jgi:preprotein translocase subunit YajC
MDLMLKALKKGDRVLTSGGILGTVVGVDEGTAAPGAPAACTELHNPRGSCR